MIGLCCLELYVVIEVNVRLALIQPLQLATTGISLSTVIYGMHLSISDV